MSNHTNNLVQHKVQSTIVSLINRTIFRNVQNCQLPFWSTGSHLFGRIMERPVVPSRTEDSAVTLTRYLGGILHSWATGKLPIAIERAYVPSKNPAELPLIIPRMLPFGANASSETLEYGREKLIWHGGRDASRFESFQFASSTATTSSCSPTTQTSVPFYWPKIGGESEEIALGGSNWFVNTRCGYMIQKRVQDSGNGLQVAAVAVLCN